VKQIYCEHSALSRNIRRLGRSGLVELVHFPYDPGSHTLKIPGIAVPSNARFSDLNLPIKDLPGRYADYVGSDRLPRILSIIGQANRRDALHVDSALKQGCVAFVTCDGDILSHRAELESLCGIRFFHPDEYDDIEQYVAGPVTVESWFRHRRAAPSACRPSGR